MKLLRWLLIFASLPAFGQASRYIGNVYTINASAPQPGALYPVLANTSATIQICTYSTTQNCPALVTTYTDATQSVSCPTNTQLTASNSSVCTAAVDAEGNFGVWVPSGNYQYMVTTTYGTFGPYPFSVGNGGGSAGTGAFTALSSTEWLDASDPIWQFKGVACANAYDISNVLDSTCSIKNTVAAATALVAGGTVPTVYLPGAPKISSVIRASCDINFQGAYPSGSQMTTTATSGAQANAFTITGTQLVPGSNCRGGMRNLAITAAQGHLHTADLVELINTTGYIIDDVLAAGTGGRGVNTVNNSERINMFDLYLTADRFPLTMTGDTDAIYGLHLSNGGNSGDGYCWSDTNCPNGIYEMYGWTATQTLTAASGSGSAGTFVVHGDTTGGVTNGSPAAGGPGISPISVGHLFTVSGATSVTGVNGVWNVATVANNTPSAGYYTITATTGINTTTGAPISFTASGSASVGSTLFQPTLAPATNPCVWLLGSSPIISGGEIKSIAECAAIAGQPSEANISSLYIENNVEDGQPQVNAGLALGGYVPFHTTTTQVAPASTAPTTITVADTSQFKSYVNDPADVPSVGNYLTFRWLPCDYLVGSITPSTCSGLSGVQRGQYEVVQGIATSAGVSVVARCLSGSTAPCSTPWPSSSIFAEAPWGGNVAMSSIEDYFSPLNAPDAKWNTLCIDQTIYVCSPVILGSPPNGITSFTLQQTQAYNVGGSEGFLRILSGGGDTSGTALAPGAGVKLEGTGGQFEGGASLTGNVQAQDASVITGNFTHGINSAQMFIVNPPALDGSYPQVNLRNPSDHLILDSTNFTGLTPNMGYMKTFSFYQDPIVWGAGYPTNWALGDQFANSKCTVDTSNATNGHVTSAFCQTGQPYGTAGLQWMGWNGSSYLNLDTFDATGNFGVAQNAQLFWLGGGGGISRPSFDQLSFGNGAYGDSTAQLNAGNIILTSASIPQMLEMLGGSTQSTAIQLANLSSGGCGWIIQSEGSANTSPGSYSLLDSCAGNSVLWRLNTSSVTSTVPVIAPSFTATGSGAGYIDLAFGTAPSAAPSGNFQQYAAASGTAYSIVWPGAQASGSNTFLSCTAANPSVCSWAAGGGGGSFSALTGDAISTSTGGATTVVGINGTLLSGLSTGLAKITTTTGAVTTVAAPTGAVVGTTDTQTLTNKSIAGSEVNSGNIPLAQLGTGTAAAGKYVDGAAGAWTALPASFANPMTTLGDVIYGGASGTATRLAGPTSGAGTYFLIDVPTTTTAVAETFSVAATGTGSPVLATSPTLITPALGTPTALVLTSATGLPTAGLVNNAVTSAKMAVANTYRTCDIPINDTSGVAITSGQMGPQSRVCFIPAASTIVEMDVNADAGTPNIIVGRNHAGTIVNIVSGALATAASGGIACTNTGGTTGINGATTCTNTLQNTSLSAGDYLELVSGTPGGTAKFFVVHVIYTVN